MYSSVSNCSCFPVVFCASLYFILTFTSLVYACFPPPSLGMSAPPSLVSPVSSLPCMHLQIKLSPTQHVSHFRFNSLFPPEAQQFIFLFFPPLCTSSLQKLETSALRWAAQLLKVKWTWLSPPWKFKGELKVRSFSSPCRKCELAEY